jgi:hypothetical protein
LSRQELRRIQKIWTNEEVGCKGVVGDITQMNKMNTMENDQNWGQIISPCFFDLIKMPLEVLSSDST